MELERGKEGYVKSRVTVPTESEGVYRPQPNPRPRSHVAPFHPMYSVFFANFLSFFTNS